MFVCSSIHLSEKQHVQISQNVILPVTGVHISALLWRQCDTLCTSGFVDDVMYSHWGVSGLEMSQLVMATEFGFGSVHCSAKLNTWPWRNRREVWCPSIALLFFICTHFVFILCTLTICRKPMLTINRRLDLFFRVYMGMKRKSKSKNNPVLSRVPRLSTWRCPQPQLGRLRLSIDGPVDRYLLHASELSSKLAARRCCCRSMVQTDGRTDGRTPHYYIDPAPNTTQAASKSRRALICPGAFINPRNFTQLVKYRGATITEFYSEY